MLSKSKPFRSKAFLKFCHNETGPAVCCLCQEKHWEELHHFGDDGGTAMKPSDNEVARTCLECHSKYGLKRRALIKNGRFDILESYQNDALKLNRLYIEHLEN